MRKTLSVPPFTIDHCGDYHLQITTEQTALQALQQLTQQKMSQAELKDILQKGAVWLTHQTHTTRIRRAKRPLKPGDTLHLYYNPKVLNEDLSEFPVLPTCLADFGSYSVWYKPKGIRSQGSKWGDFNALYRWVERHDTQQRPAFIIHRLDRMTDGIMLLAHRKKTAKQLTGQFEKRETEKRYLAWVKGRFPESPITCDAPLDGKEAVSHFQRNHYDDKLQQSLMDIKIDTGRKHQIRRHLQMLGHPIIGDRLYGESGEVDMQLSNYFLGFICPESGERQSFNLLDSEIKPQLQSFSED